LNEYLVSALMNRGLKAAGQHPEENMSRAADYRKWAEECTGLAQTARTPAQRTMLLHIADTWHRLASDADDEGGSDRPPDAAMRLM
jgi:hypothetical protein